MFKLFSSFFCNYHIEMMEGNKFFPPNVSFRPGVLGVVVSSLQSVRTFYRYDNQSKSYARIIS